MPVPPTASAIDKPTRKRRASQAVLPKQDYLKALDLAHLMGADVKTVHNHCDSGKFPHFRTPGRHLRFRPREIVPVLRELGYTIPEALEIRELADRAAAETPTPPQPAGA